MGATKNDIFVMEEGRPLKTRNVKGGQYVDMLSIATRPTVALPES